MAATYQDLVELDLPEWQIGEIISGELVVRRLPPPRAAHAHSSLIGLLAEVGLYGPWWILTRVELCLGSDVFVPDLSAWRRERMPVLSSEPPWIELAPDWVCDVLTDQSREVVLNAKPSAYARHGIADWWIVDPDAQTVAVKRLAGAAYESVETSHGAASLQASPFDALRLDLHYLWRL